MKMYQANTLIYPEIEEVEVDRQTEHTVWINGRATRKHDGWKSFHDTWDEAKEYLIAKYKQNAETAKARYDNAKGKLEIAKNLQP